MTTTSQGYESAEQELEAVRGWYNKAGDDLAESEAGRLDALAENARLRALITTFISACRKAGFTESADLFDAVFDVVRDAALDAGKEGR